LEYAPEGSAPQACGKGWVLRDKRSPAEFADAEIASSVYLPLMALAVAKTGAETFNPAPYFAMKRGDYVIAHSIEGEFRRDGAFVDIFDDTLAVVDAICLPKGQSGIYRDVAEKIQANVPCVLQTTYRLIEQEYTEGCLKLTVKGPAGNDCVARVFLGDFSIKEIKASAGREQVAIQNNQENLTTMIQFPNHVEGVTVTIHFSKKLQS
jgi:hypothetical protein